MFRKLNRCEADDDMISFRVIFSNFEALVKMNSATIDGLRGSVVEAVIIKACLNTNNHHAIVRYLTDFYHKFFTTNRKPKALMLGNMQFWQSKIDAHCPELEYGKKYYPCVLRNLQSLYGNSL